jgi:hypothetical protein
MNQDDQPTELTIADKKRLFATLDAQTRQLDKLEVGMYGDKQLKIPGLVNDMIDVKAWITKYKLRIAYIAGICTLAGFLVKAAWEYIIGSKK